MERVYKFLKQQDQNEKLTHVIFEARGRKEDEELELEFRRVCDSRSHVDEHLRFDIVMANKQSNSSRLQLADITARPIGLSVIRPEQPNQAFEIIERKFFKGRYGAINGNGLKVFP